MAHRFTFTVTVEVERTTGKFAARDEMADAIREELEGSDPGGLYGLGADGESEYDVTSWEVDEAE
ncbi:hypothetical protein ACFWGP_05460 [Agromyces sp. NPDC127015]|uniref:hypothetical protein n=1 Tax=Agromyces sp. NPDC127015 TaxID=3347108 RepID=UPI00366446BB